MIEREQSQDQEPSLEEHDRDYEIQWGPLEANLVRAARSSKVLECRMIVSELDGYDFGWTGRVDRRRKGGNEHGGFEIRRQDWESVREKIRKTTAFYWEGRTIYVVRSSTFINQVFGR